MTSVLVDLGFSGFTYLEADKDQFALHYCTYSEVWVKKYKEMEYGLIDPVIDLMHKEKSPFTWDCNDFAKDPNRDIREFFKDAKKHGISQGISVPLRRGSKKSCVFTVVSPDNELETASLIKYIKLIAENFNMMFLSIREGVATTLAGGFSEREKQCMALTAFGASNTEVAEILNITKRTVEQHLQAARDRIGAGNIASAVAFFVDTGVIHVNRSGFSQLSRPLLFGIPPRIKN